MPSLRKDARALPERVEVFGIPIGPQQQRARELRRVLQMFGRELELENRLAARWPGGAPFRTARASLHGGLQVRVDGRSQASVGGETALSSSWPAARPGATSCGN